VTLQYSSCSDVPHWRNQLHFVANNDADRLKAEAVLLTIVTEFVGEAIKFLETLVKGFLSHTSKGFESAKLFGI